VGAQRPGALYLAPDGALMSVPVSRGTTWTAGSPARVLEGRYYRGVSTNVSRTYDVSVDGRRFLMIKPATVDQTAPPASIVVVENWMDELRRLVRAKR
jgi:hypothetical protein